MTSSLPFCICCDTIASIARLYTIYVVGFGNFSLVYDESAHNVLNMLAVDMLNSLTYSMFFFKYDNANHYNE